METTQMKLPETIFEIVSRAGESVTPQQIRDRIKHDYPTFYGTASAERNVAAGNYGDIDQALLSAIYTAVKKDERYLIDRSTRPYRVSVESSEAIEQALDSAAGEDLEHVSGIVYVLGTGVYTKGGGTYRQDRLYHPRPGDPHSTTLYDRCNVSV